MQRRSFRASTGTEARYPRLCEMVTLGGLLLGGAACTPGHAAPGAEQPPKSSPAPEPRRDGGAPPIPTPMHTAGVPMPQRIDPPAKDAGKTDVPKKDSSAKHPKSDKKGPRDADKKGTTSAPSTPKKERIP